MGLHAHPLLPRPRPSILTLSRTFSPSRSLPFTFSVSLPCRSCPAVATSGFLGSSARADSGRPGPTELRAARTAARKSASPRGSPWSPKSAARSGSCPRLKAGPLPRPECRGACAGASGSRPPPSPSQRSAPLFPTSGNLRIFPALAAAEILTGAPPAGHPLRPGLRERPAAAPRPSASRKRRTPQPGAWRRPAPRVGGNITAARPAPAVQTAASPALCRAAARLA